MPRTIVPVNIWSGVICSFGSAMRPLKARGRLNNAPITRPCIDQWCIERQLMPMTKPMRVRLAIIWRMTGVGSRPGPLDASAKQTKAKRSPERVATNRRFGFFIMVFLLLRFFDGKFYGPV